MLGAIIKEIAKILYTNKPKNKMEISFNLERIVKIVFEEERPTKYVFVEKNTKPTWEELKEICV